MSQLETLRASFPDAARDIKLNLSAVLQADGSHLTKEQRWGVAVASAVASRSEALRQAVVADARADGVADAVIDDALAAAALMAMNNVYYRFRHLVGKQAYSDKPARLRMNRIAKPLTSKIDFELFSLAVSAINACEACIKSHEATVVTGGLSEDAVHDAVRIAATFEAAAVSLELRDVVAVAAVAA